MAGGWQEAVAERLAKEGFELDGGSRWAVVLGMMDAVAYPLLANWLGWLADHSDDHDALAAALGPLGADLLARVEQRAEEPVLASAWRALDDGGFGNLVLLVVATLKYIDWRAVQSGAAAQGGTVGGFHASADQAITDLVERTGGNLETEGDLPAYLAALSPASFVAAPLLELQEESERLGMMIFE
jgi:hypothetical protein